MRAALFLSALFIAACAELGPTQTQIDAIESSIIMPEGADALDSYSRFYTTRDGRVIEGEYVSGDAAYVLEDRRVQRQLGERTYIVDPFNMPGVMDGGCGILTLSYNTETREVSGPFCNGVA